LAHPIFEQIKTTGRLTVIESYRKPSQDRLGIYPEMPLQRTPFVHSPSFDITRWSTFAGVEAMIQLAMIGLNKLSLDGRPNVRDKFQ
jgi:hypothetical protein